MGTVLGWRREQKLGKAGPLISHRPSLLDLTPFEVHPVKEAEGAVLAMGTGPPTCGSWHCRLPVR